MGSEGVGGCRVVVEGDGGGGCVCRVVVEG